MKNFERPEFDIVELEIKDVILTSTCASTGYYEQCLAGVNIA